MAQDIQISGQTYENVPSVKLSTPSGETASFTEISDSTVTADTLADGVVAYSSDGTRLTGTLTGGGGEIYCVHFNYEFDSQNDEVTITYCDGYSYEQLLEKHNEGKTIQAVCHSLDFEILYGFEYADLSLYQSENGMFMFSSPSDSSGKSFSIVADPSGNLSYTKGSVFAMLFSSHLNDKVDTNAIKNNAVTEDKLSVELKSKVNSRGTVVLDNSITEEKLYDSLRNKINNKQDALSDGSISNTLLGDGVVSTSKLSDSSVTTTKIADNSITSAKIEDSSILKNDLHSTLRDFIPTLKFVVSSSVPTEDDTSLVTFVVSS